MARATFNELIAEVRAQIDVPDLQAYTWLLDRARVMNNEASWDLRSLTFQATGARSYLLSDDVIKTEAVLIGATPLLRSTLRQLDSAYAHTSTVGLYADAADERGDSEIQVYPPYDSGTFTLRFVADVPDSRSASPPFPADFDQGLVDGAVAIGLARMDERFDSATYFEGRFTSEITRLRRRRHGHVGRGAVPIRVVM